jgi:pilus assembly protein Flp/PilA
MKAMLKKLFADEKGLETVEYAIITGLIVVATITAITNIGNWVNTQFTTLDGALNPAP